PHSHSACTALRGPHNFGDGVILGWVLAKRKRGRGPPTTSQLTPVSVTIGAAQLDLTASHPPGGVAVPSPFPGIDPYLEAPPPCSGFQQQFVTCLYQLLLPNLADRYNPRPVRRTYHTEMPLFTSVIREEHIESFVEVRRRTDSRLVTLIDVVSPANKTTTQARPTYLPHRRL